MVSTRSLALFLAALVAMSAAAPPRGALIRVRRQLLDDNALQPLEDAEGEAQAREKRKLEGVTQAKFGIKNAVLGFVFGSGTTSRRRTREAHSLVPSSSHHSTREVPRDMKQRLRGTEQQLRAMEPRERRQADDGIPVFDRNKVSLDFPSSLFGPSVSLLIRTTKIIGDVIQNSAVRYQSFLRLFQPLFRGPFEIKGLDPPTTTTTTTTTSAPSVSDNEVR